MQLQMQILPRMLVGSFLVIPTTGGLLGKIQKADLQKFFDKKSVMWTPTWYDHLLDTRHFHNKQLRLSTFDGTPDEFYDLMIKED
jgi:hypothetical protein